MISLWTVLYKISIFVTANDAQSTADGDKRPPEKTLSKPEDADSLQDEEANLEVNAAVYVCYSHTTINN